MTTYDKYTAPGVYREQIFLDPIKRLRTGVPVFLGLVETTTAGDGSNAETPEPFTRWSQFELKFGHLAEKGFLAGAVRGFFENGGNLCYVQIARYGYGSGTKPEALNKGLQTLETLRDVDLVCVPDIMWTPQQGTLSESDAVRMQIDVLRHCQTLGDRFAILDALPNSVSDTWEQARDRVIGQRRELLDSNGALYFPWIKVRSGPEATEELIPPCGHVAGVIADTDERRGVHKAPANEVLQGVVDLEFRLNDAQQGELNPIGVNCLRVFPGRGIRVWGARTLSNEPDWLYINVKRIFLTADRWIERNMFENVVFEPNNSTLWAHITRDLTAYFTDLFRLGVLKGATPEQAFYVKCNEETNPKELRDLGEVVTEIGLAPTQPFEFIVVRIVHRVSGVTIEGPTKPM